MADNARIEWTDMTWKPTKGATTPTQSKGDGGGGGRPCCYAEVIAQRLSKMPKSVK